MKHSPATRAQTLALRIEIGARAFGDAYPVRMRAGASERTAELVLPPALAPLAERLAHAGTQPLPDPGALGQAMGRALFSPPLRDMLLGSARQAARDGLRLQIQLQIAPPELAALPWEWLAVGGERPWLPALRGEYALARVSRSLPPVPPLRVAGPLQVLALAAPGEELQLAALQEALQEAVRAGALELRLVGDATPAALERALAARPVHVLHCAAPVARTERGAPRLLLRRGLDLFDLAGLLADAAKLRLVTLAGPQGDGRALHAALPIVSAALLTPRLPAAIAFGGALPARLSARFAATCYAALAAGQPVDLAVTAGRRALAELGDGRGWGMPQLRMAAGSAQIFTAGGGGWSMPAGRWWRGAALGGAGAILAGALALGLPQLRGAQAFVFSAASAAPTPALALAELPSPAAPATAAPTAEPAPATAAPTAEPAPATAAPTAEPAPATVAPPIAYAEALAGPDETLGALAERMGSDPGAIAALNHMAAGEPLRPERPLVIPVYRAAEAGVGGQIIRRGNPAARNVALTFDIEIDAQTLYDMLAILRERGLHGTFFLTGRWVMAFPDAARAIVAEGHEVGNHSLTHPSFARIGLDGAEAEIAQTEQIIQSTLGVTARPYFRFPYGDATADTLSIVGRDGYVAYHWGADDGSIGGWIDWAAQHPDEASGGILLMHGRPSTVAALPGWLDRLTAQGFRPTTLTETLR